MPPASTQSATLGGLAPGTAASAASLAPGATSAPPASGARLAQMIDAVRTAIDTGARQGISQTRIVLSPPSLGGVQIHLKQTPDGLVARVVAENPDAARTLQQGSGDLRQSLQSQGLTLLRLDIESSDQRGAATPDPRATYGSRQPGHADVDVESVQGVTDPQPPSNALPAGSRVDLLA